MKFNPISTLFAYFHKTTETLTILLLCQGTHEEEEQPPLQIVSVLLKRRVASQPHEEPN